jgi:predicted enzyme related to lactoylglutathione lyase
MASAHADERKRIYCTDVAPDSDCRIRAAVIESHYPAGMSLDAVAQHPVALVEFPADDPEQALRFWVGVLGLDLQQRQPGEGAGWQTHSGHTELGVHRRGPGPGDRFSLPYFSVPDLPAALRRVEELGGSVIHPRPPWAICRDSEGNPFALMAAQPRQRAQ